MRMLLFQINICSLCMHICVCMIYFSWHKIITWGLRNQWFLNVKYVLSIIKVAEGIKILLPWSREISLHMQLTFLGKKFAAASWKKINHFAIEAFLSKFSIVFPAISCWLKALGICAENVWIRSYFLYDVGW